MFKPTSLSATFGLAKLQEEDYHRRKKGNISRNTYPINSNLSKIVTTGNINHNSNRTNISTKPFSSGAATPTSFNNKMRIPIRRLNPQQMQERREKGLCYNYEEKYHPGHRCIRPKLFLVEEVEEVLHNGVEEETCEIAKQNLTEEENEKEELLQISLQALAGSFEPRTMRLQGQIKHLSVVMLVDTGSTHNFIDLQTTKLMKLAIHPSKLKVKVANGAEVLCSGRCKDTVISLQNLKFKVDLLVIPLGGCEVVLGIEWLRHLGSITWNFADLSMRFSYGGEEVTL